jgi:hypothetical protein
MAKNAVVYFNPQDSDLVAQAPVLLEIIVSNMRKPSSLTLRILKSLYPRADLDAESKGCATTCIEEEAEKIVEDFVESATWVIKMIPVDMS